MESLYRGTSRMDAARGLGAPADGPWMALPGRPPERRCNEGTPAQLGPDVGARPFGYFWGNAKSNPLVRAELSARTTR